jgi:ferredoxin--NADP+ reductase
MSQLVTERVLQVHHWNDTLFSFRTTRDTALRFRNGHFVMLGLPADGKPLLRACGVSQRALGDYVIERAFVEK